MAALTWDSARSIVSNGGNIHSGYGSVVAARLKHSKFLL
jgi:hypothetical protein